MLGKTVKIIAVVVLIVLVIALVVPGAASHLKTSSVRAGQFIDRKVSIEQLIERARVELREAQNELKKHTYDKINLEVSLENLESDKESLEARMDVEMRKLKIAKSVIEVNKDHEKTDMVVVGDNEYQLAKILQDAENRMNRIDRISERLSKTQIMVASHKNVLAQLNENISNAQEIIRERAADIERAEGELAALQSEKKSLEMLAKITSFTNILGPESGVTNAFNAIEERKARLEADIQVLREQVIPGSGGKDIVEYELPGSSIIDRLGNYFPGSSPEISSEEVSDLSLN